MIMMTKKQKRIENNKHRNMWTVNPITKVVKDNHKNKRNKERAKSLGYTMQPIFVLDKNINLLYNINSKGDEFK